MIRNPMTTLCYLEKDDSYLMLHRVKKVNDVNKDKWIGIGGHLEQGESPEECLIRETMEETGLTLHSFRFRGLVTFYQDGYGTEYMCLFTSDDFEGDLKECNEGTLEWVAKKDMRKLNLWEGDFIFLDLLDREDSFFTLKLEYEGDRLVKAVKNGTQVLHHA